MIRVLSSKEFCCGKAFACVSPCEEVCNPKLGLKVSLAADLSVYVTSDSLRMYLAEKGGLFSNHPRNVTCMAMLPREASALRAACNELAHAC